jgi:SET domain-containing protein
VIDDVEVRDAGTKGKGVFAKRAFRKGEFIFRRRNGPRVSSAELANLSEVDQMHITELGFDEFAVIHPPGAYLNHACDPNAMRSGVKVFAWTDIAAGEEITIDYRLNAFTDSDGWPCACGTPSCNGWVVGSFFMMDPQRQVAYLPHAPPFIRREYRRRQKHRSG